MKSYSQLARHEGNETLFETVEMGIISMLWNVPVHIHAEGLRGTGKTTIMRAAQQIMPPIVRIKNCLYNCDPEAPHCPEHKNLSKEEIMQIGIETIPRPFLEISHSAKIGTIVGSIDLQKITSSANPEAALLPGIIPQAHRGVIFIDEINRLADTSPEITDILLDAMGTKPGRVQIEETGLPVIELPVQVSVWAASNPDEDPGPLQEIRRQLSDRFDLVVDMGRPTNAESITEVLLQSQQRRLKNVVSANTPVNDSLHIQKELAKIAEKFEALEMPDYLRNYIARIYLKYDLESFRAIEAIQHAAILHCALRQRQQLLISDILKVIPLALRHRVDVKTLTRIINSSDSTAPSSNKSYNNSSSSFGSSSVNSEITSNFSEADFNNNDYVAASDYKAKENKTILSPLKGLFKRENHKITDNTDPVKASPLNKAKRLPDVNTDDLIKTEKDLQ